jgi:hypothetical protein
MADADHGIGSGIWNWEQNLELNFGGTFTLEDPREYKILELYSIIPCNLKFWNYTP